VTYVNEDRVCTLTRNYVVLYRLHNLDTRGESSAEIWNVYLNGATRARTDALKRDSGSMRRLFVYERRQIR